ncbi:MAG: hypothetical protein AAF667_19325 [Pseudomonadota bacterium]
MLRSIWIALKILVFLAMVAAGFVFYFVLEDTPLLTDGGPPKPEDVVAARTFVRGVKQATRSDDAEPPELVLAEDDLNSIVRLGARLLPGLRSQVEVKPNEVRGAVAIPVPGIARWLNLTASAPPFSGQVRLESVTAGPFDLPPDLSFQLGRVGANLIFGNGLGDALAQSASKMSIDGQNVVVELSIDSVGKNGFLRGVFGTMRSAEMPGPDEIDGYYRQIRRAMDGGTLPTSGSYLPYIQFTLQAALEGSDAESLPNAYTAAMFALARACGARDFTLIVGRLAGDLGASGDWAANCKDVTLNGRIDSRRHFTTAAALQAASNRGFAVSIGEFKELYDSAFSDSGFDFTDIAANNSGVRMSNRLMSAPPDAWPALLERIATEPDVIVPFETVPQIMPRAEFEATYGDVESPAYKAEVARIEAQIDLLKLHQLP